MASYEKRENGKWAVRFRVVENGKLVNKRLSGFDKKKTAEEAYTKYLSEAKSKENTVNESDIKSFDKIIDNYIFFLENEREVTESTLVTDRPMINTHIIPFFGKLDITKITDADLRKFKDTIKDYSFNYKTKIFNRLGSILKFIDREYNTDIYKYYNKVPKFKNKTEVKKIKFWEYNQYQKFISVVDDEHWKLFFDCLYYSGCRKSELIGLKTKKIDFKNDLFIIDSQVSYKTKDDSLFKDTRPKSKNSVRDIFMPHSIINDLKQFIEKNDKSENDYVFGSNRPVAIETLRQKFKYYTNLYNRKNPDDEILAINVHDLRHSHVSFIINYTEGGELNKLYVIADRLGDTVEQILKTYGHLFRSSQINLRQDIENIIKKEK